LLTRDRSIGKPVTRNLTIILLEKWSVNVLKVLKKVLISKIDWKNAFRCRFLAFSYHVHRHVLPTDNFRRSIGLHFLCIFPTFTNNFAIFMHGCNIIMCLSTNNTILHYILSLEPHLSFFLEPSLAAKDTCLQRTLWGGPMGCPLQTGFTVHSNLEKTNRPTWVT
jgi:hypothetical protein